MDEPLTTDSDDSDDPIVQEIPILHSNHLENSLHLFQFPLQRHDCKDEQIIRKCFVKPQNEEIQLELAINTNSQNFDLDRAEFIVKGMAQDSPEKDELFKNKIVDRVLLQSQKTIKDANKYAVATYNGKEIHLTALKGIYQFRPIFPYMGKGQKRKTETNANQDSDEEAGPSGAQQVTVRFKSLDEKKQPSYKALQSKKADESWVECEWNESDSTPSCVERLKLISDCTDDLNQTKVLSNSEYVKLLIPEDKEQVPLEPTLPSHVLSLHSLRALPVLEQCRLLLKDAQIIQFQQLLMLLAGGEGLTAEILLRTLPVVAVLVRGNWVVKSEVLYPANTFSSTSGVPAELMCRARDYVLYLFTKHQYVERKTVSSILKIPSEELKEIFTGISKLRRHNKEWELQLPTDVEFINKHSELVNKQNAYWGQRFQQLSEFLKDNKAQRRKSRSESKSISEDSKNKNIVYFSSDNESGTEKSKSPVASRKNKSTKVNGENAKESCS
ncbi:unnamed protein product [Callosobruchus maculatus]|uniref:DNA-directed RNA polymerase III subunit RPC5 n=1 Tax=Callosobruchus maculatus TaxID=64391 RepID=A0A653CKA0_CALMS|nr:unnamed protein product [Callosobruchus maculatus]